MFLNTVYIWPKMLAGALALAALAVVVSRDRAGRWRGAGVLAAALAALSLLSHGGTIFALLALAALVLPLVVSLRRKLTAGIVAACAAGAVAVAALYLPWLLYQRYVDPPGNRLVKWMLAGVISVDRRGSLHTIVDQYRSLSLSQLLANKWNNTATLVASPAIWHRQHADAAWLGGGFLGYARVAGVNDLLPAAGPLLLGAAALLLPSARRRLVDAKPLAVFTALALAAWVVLLWGGQSEVGLVTTQVHQGPYAAIVLFIGLCAFAVTALPPVFRAVVLTASAAWFAVEWLPGLAWRPADQKTPASSPVDWSMAIVCGCALAAIIAIVVAACRKTDARADGRPLPGYLSAHPPAGSAIIDVPTARKPSRA
jgi:hypothetical protein